MLSEIKISSKITALLLSVVLVSVFAISLLSYSSGKQAVEERYWENLTVMSRLKAKQIKSYFDQVQANMVYMATSPQVSAQVSRANLNFQRNQDTLLRYVDAELRPLLEPIQGIQSYHNIVLTNQRGEVVFKSNPTATQVVLGKPYAGFSELLAQAERTQQEVYFGVPFESNTHVYHIYMASPVHMAGGEVGGMLIVELNMRPIDGIVEDYTGMEHSETGEVVLGRRVGNQVQYLNRPKNSTNIRLTQKVLINNREGEALQKAVKGLTGQGITRDYYDHETLSAWTFIPGPEWGLVVKVDKKEIDKHLDSLIVSFVLAGLFITIVSLAVALIFSQVLVAPLQKLKNILNIIARGELPEKVETTSNDEIGEMANALDNLVHNLKRTALFAYRIGEGDYTSKFTPLSQNDVLGTALLSMRDSIQEADKKDKERTWIVSGVAEIGQILKEQNELTALGDSVLEFVTPKVNAIQAAFYSAEEDKETEEAFLMMQASYAYNKKKYLKGRFGLSEGLPGQCFLEKDLILRTEIPQDYVTLTSGILEDSKPSCLLFVPLITDEKVFGILEFASFERFTDTQIEFLKQISLTIARTVANIKVNQRTIQLLQESQQMSEELQVQQEILRNNAEEMESTQEQLQRSNVRLEEQVQEVNRTQRRMQMLLENASEVISIYERDGKVRYISPSVEPILGYTQDELIGVSDIVNTAPEHKETVKQMFAQLAQYPDETVSIQFKYRKKDGTFVWLEATGTNLLDDQAIKGLLVNSRDITERRRAEKEARMRGQMQSLSENSPDLIMRLNAEGKVFYINPTIKALTGLRPEHFLERNIRDASLKKEIIKFWLGLTEQAVKKGEAINTEMHFPALREELIMQVNALPEYNENKEVESVLIVAHDITERKRTEIQIRDTNRKISESINYAQRIQGAILPDNDYIRRFLPDSFVFYRPRDVVSGDFPWFIRKNEHEIFIAAVDCTGHGVPGALISLIGYFLLNTIVRERQEVLPGEMLDLLNAEVTQTLRQDDENSNTKDGMDIALAKINFEAQTLDYSGAHRPLYLLSDGELHQTKGDRFPIGGGSKHYRKRVNFTNHHIDLKKGDTFYMFSDGLPDQFGGPENRKYSPRRIRDLVQQNASLSMEEMEQEFAKSLDAWQGEQKQTDDILMIGIRF